MSRRWTGALALLAGWSVSPMAAGGDHPIYAIAGDAPGGRFGTAVAIVGDADGDGVVDVAIGAPQAGGPGRAVLVSGADGTISFDLAKGPDSQWFGQSVAGVGDLDGDGHADVAIGDPYGGPSGRVVVHSGSSGLAILTLAGVKSGDRFGHAVAEIGDVDLDGTVDVLVGAPFADGAVKDTGRAAVLSGADGAVVVERFGVAFFDHHGYAVSTVGDADFDGVPDLLIGAPFSDGGAFNGGEAFVHSGATGTLLQSIAGDGTADQLGFRVAAAGDVDGDGTPDAAVGVPASDTGGLDSGRAVVIRVADGALLLDVAGQQSGDSAGFLAGAGDVDGDGHDDLAVGSPSAGVAEAGRVQIMSGRDGTELVAWDGASAYGWFGYAVAAGVDLNGDGAPDLIAGAPGHDDHLIVGAAEVRSVVAMPLSAGGHLHPLGAGGSTGLCLDAGLAHAGRRYVMLGTTAGTTPGLPLGDVLLPLNPDSGYFLYTATSPGSPPLLGSVGTLDAAGRAAATFTLPPGLSTSAAGITLHHAYVVLDETDAVVLASNAVSLTLTP